MVIRRNKLYDAVECWIDPDWPMITGAIWRTVYTDAAWEYNNLPEGGWYFQRIFTLENVPAMAQIMITADNFYRLYINGAYIGGDGPMNRDGPQHEEWRSIETYDISNALVKGQNTILIRALNCWESDNPAGLIFKATLTYAPDYVISGYPFGTITALITGIITLLTLRFTRAHSIDLA